MREIALACHFYMAEAPEANDGSQRQTRKHRTVISTGDRNVIEPQDSCSDKILAVISCACFANSREAATK
jgi:hypothetical protein